MKKIIVIDDHPVIVVAIKACLEKTGDLSVIDVSDNGLDGLEKVKLHQPDLVILDLFLPKTDGLGMIRRIKAVSEKIKVLVLTGHVCDNNGAANEIRKNYCAWLTRIQGLFDAGGRQ